MINQLPFEIDESWTLFLDRDGVINKRLPGKYIKKIDEFEFEYRFADALKVFDNKFNRIVIVTNQQGIGKGLMTGKDLQIINLFLYTFAENLGCTIDKIYYCPELATDDSSCRKPNTGMGLQAKNDFKDIDFKKSIMVGDSISDIQFGKNLQMKTVFIKGKQEEEHLMGSIQPDLVLDSLFSFSELFI